MQSADELLRSGFLSQNARIRLLIGLLLLAGVAFLVTRPLRARLARDTARIARETALRAEALRRVSELGNRAAGARRRIEANPGDARARLDLAAALGQARQYPEAVRQIEVARSLDPRSPEPHVALGEISDATGHPDVAVEEFRKALALDPAHPRALELLAYKYIAFGWN